MTRTYDRIDVQKQLTLLSDFIQNHFPGHYAEHLAKIGHQGIGERAMIIMTELKMKTDALGKAMVEAQIERSALSDKEAEEINESFPPVPGCPEIKLRGISMKESYQFADINKPVWALLVEDDKPQRYIYGNIVGHIEDEDGNFELDINIGSDVHRINMCRVFVEEK